MVEPPNDSPKPLFSVSMYANYPGRTLTLTRFLKSPQVREPVAVARGRDAVADAAAVRLRVLRQARDHADGELAASGRVRGVRRRRDDHHLRGSGLQPRGLPGIQ